MLNQDWLTFDALLERAEEITSAEKLERLWDGTLMAQAMIKDIKKRARQLESIARHEKQEPEGDKRGGGGMRDFLSDMGRGRGGGR